MVLDKQIAKKQLNCYYKLMQLSWNLKILLHGLQVGNLLFIATIELCSPTPR